MASNYLELVKRFSHNLGTFRGYEAVARTVEAVTAYLIFFIIFIGQGADVSVIGDRAVIRRIENAYLRNLGKKLFASFDALYCGRSVQGWR